MDGELAQTVQDFLAVSSGSFSEVASWTQKFSEATIKDRGLNRRGIFQEGVVQLNQTDPVLNLAERMANASPEDVREVAEILKEKCDLDKTYGRGWNLPAVLTVYMLEAENFDAARALNEVVDSSEAKAEALRMIFTGTAIDHHPLKEMNLGYIFLPEERRLLDPAFSIEKARFLVEDLNAPTGRLAQPLTELMDENLFVKYAEARAEGLGLPVPDPDVFSNPKGSFIPTRDEKGDSWRIYHHNASEEVKGQLIDYMIEAGEITPGHLRAYARGDAMSYQQVLGKIPGELLHTGYLDERALGLNDYTTKLQAENAALEVLEKIADAGGKIDADYLNHVNKFTLYWELPSDSAEEKAARRQIVQRAEDLLLDVSGKETSPQTASATFENEEGNGLTGVYHGAATGETENRASQDVMPTEKIDPPRPPVFQ